MTTLIIIGVIIVLLIIYLVMTYNRLIAEIEAVENSKRQIDVQLDRRSKTFQSLINVVKKYMDFEKTLLKDVTKLRQQSLAAKDQGDEKTHMQAEEQLSQIAKGIQVQFENYPDLKASNNVSQLQEEITNTENKLAFSKQAYNDAIEKYNADKKSFFASMVVNVFKNQLDKAFIYWHIDDQARQTAEDYRVEL